MAVAWACPVLQAGDVLLGGRGIADARRPLARGLFAVRRSVVRFSLISSFPQHLMALYFPRRKRGALSRMSNFKLPTFACICYRDPP